MFDKIKNVLITFSLILVLVELIFLCFLINFPNMYLDFIDEIITLTYLTRKILFIWNDYIMIVI